MAGSVALHILIAGGMVLFGVYLASLFYKPVRTLPIEPVRIVSGGGGAKNGVAGGGKAAPGTGAEDVGPEATAELTQPGEVDAPPRPALAEAKVKELNEKFDPDAVRIIAKSETGKALAGLQASVRDKLSKGLASAKAGSGGGPGDKGEGGPGGGGGKGKGTGPGEGDGVGPGKATLSKREKRMLRWHMRFTANSGPEYLAQLRGLGAILAFPVTEGADPQYKVVRDLRRGGACSYWKIWRRSSASTGSTTSRTR